MRHLPRVVLELDPLEDLRAIGEHTRVAASWSMMHGHAVILGPAHCRACIAIDENGNLPPGIEAVRINKLRHRQNLFRGSESRYQNASELDPCHMMSVCDTHLLCSTHRQKQTRT